MVTWTDAAGVWKWHQVERFFILWKYMKVYIQIYNIDAKYITLLRRHYTHIFGVSVFFTYPIYRYIKQWLGVMLSC